MDPFQKLAPELRIQILLSLGTFQAVIAASHASPALFQQCRESSGYLFRHYITRDLDQDLMQDALAVILFPAAAESTTYVDETRRVALVDAHLRNWGAKELPDPCVRDSIDMVRVIQLDTLCYRLWLYIEDYLSKASEFNLPRAYRRLPRWSHPSFSYGTKQQEELQREGAWFSFDMLSQAQRRRMLQAFLRYELLCKVYGPIGGELDPDHIGINRHHDRETEEQTSGYEFSPDDPFRHWDWRLLYRYEQREPEESELQLLPCVREYVLALYGAMIADQVWVKLPDRFLYSIYDNAPCGEMGGFPDYNRKSPWKELYRFGGTGWSDLIVSLMASTGFDLLTSTLTSSNTSFREFLCSFYTEVCNSPPYIDATNVNVPNSAPSHMGRIGWYCNDFIRLHRQRAWALQLSNRIIPRLPTVRRYEGVFGPAARHGLVGWGLKSDRTRNESIAHGKGIRMYPALLDKRVPFWKTVWTKADVSRALLSSM